MAVIAVATAICTKTGQWQEKMKSDSLQKTVKVSLCPTFKKEFDTLRRWFTDPSNLLMFLSLSNPLENNVVTKVSDSEIIP